MNATRKQRLLREALGEQEGGMPAAEGVLLASAAIVALLAFVLVVG
jgi:hypothetical protein